ncbi:hypothetical protein NMN56_027530 [Streptomyces iconiensis]|uniref:Tetratricopeptide repeat protein n=2 Tax=Streptomyces iconiensis TaxID=1384038 RepID=A0ABT7A2T9_9ACTN|nr:hypothetical protein [Streptomyces iconiensis]MDJ1135637.1 hypothetical protein [Streptomyces iconiensis]
MVRIGQAIMLHRGGDREEARNRFTLLWKETEDTGHLFHRCTIAHYMADTQDDPADELEWDLRALSAADALSEERVSWGEHLLAVRALYPSLYLNLAADHAKLGDPHSARRDLDRARGTLDALGDDAYGDGIRAAIERLELRLADDTAH